MLSLKLRFGYLFIKKKVNAPPAKRRKRYYRIKIPYQVRDDEIARSLLHASSAFEILEEKTKQGIALPFSQQVQARKQSVVPTQI